MSEIIIGIRHMELDSGQKSDPCPMEFICWLGKKVVNKIKSKMPSIRWWQEPWRQSMDVGKECWGKEL